jgi:hypothetical protein
MTTITPVRAALTLATYALAWGFCLDVGLRFGAAWGVAAFVLMELRAYAAAQSTRRYLLRKEGA